MYISKKGSTLIELLMTVVILAILWTIAVFSLQGYHQKARDSVRISELANIQKSLELYLANQGQYPEPTNPQDITYLWLEVWKQWVIWESVVTQLLDLSDKPVDPLTGTEYTYSRLNTKDEFQLATILEKWPIVSIINQGYAWDQLATAYVSGTYNGLFAKVYSWSTTYVLSVPTIINWDMSLTDIIEIKDAQKFVFSWYGNLPWNYSDTVFKVDGGFDYNPIDIIIYEWDINNLWKESDWVSDFVQNLQLAYSGSELGKIWKYNTLVSLDVSDTTSTNRVICGVINKYLGKCSDEVVNIVIAQGNGWDWRLVDSNCDQPDVTIWTQTWAGCNSTIWAWDEYSIDENCYDYQWWATTGCNNLSNEKENIYNWIYWVDNIWWKLYTWDSLDTDNDNDIDIDDTNLVCWEWYHVPSDNEWAILENVLAGTTCRTWDGWQCNWLGWQGHDLKTPSNNIVNALNIPLVGYESSGTFYDRGRYTSLWSNTTFGSYAYYRSLNWINPTVLRYSGSQSIKFSVRCIKSVIQI